MKRLSKDERTGATAIALVALLICGGSFLWNRRERGTTVPEEMVKSMILASDTLGSGSESTVGKETGNSDESDLHISEADGNEGKSLRKRGSSENKKKKKGSEKSVKKKKKDAAPPRDFLADPI